MSSASALPAPECQELSGRIAVMEDQHRRMIDAQAQTLAEIRALRQDFNSYASSISAELTRVYEAVASKG